MPDTVFKGEAWYVGLQCYISHRDQFVSEITLQFDENQATKAPTNSLLQGPNKRGFHHFNDTFNNACLLLENSPMLFKFQAKCS